MHSLIFSIIIPAYNAERYLRECLDSLVCQSFDDFEVIIVNDGSRDLTEAICREYIETDNRFRLINKENGGVSTARNAGLEYAKGEWILFMDADDILNNSALNEIRESIKSNPDSVMHIWGWEEFSKEGVSLEHMYFDLHNPVSVSDLRTRLFKGKPYMGYLWTKVFKIELIGNLRFDVDIKYNEDRLFIFNYLSKISKKCSCSIIPSILYRYRKHSESAMANLNRWNPYFITDIVAFYKMALSAHNEGNNDLLNLIVHNAWFNIRILKRNLNGTPYHEVTLADRNQFYNVSSSLLALVYKHTIIGWYINAGLKKISRMINK